MQQDRKVSPRTQKPASGASPKKSNESGNNSKAFEYAARCRVIRKIADGGMGTVYLGEQVGEVGFAKTVALKVIRRDKLEDEKVARLFVEEAKLVADLVHQNILQVYNLASYRGVYFIVMEFLHGITAREFLERHRDRRVPLRPEAWALRSLGEGGRVGEDRLPPVDLAAFIVSRVCRALAYAHEKRDRKGRPLGIVHRDVTPTNIMIDYRGFVKLSDFGIAKAARESTPNGARFIMGKYPYMSPEQARGERTGPGSDIFSLGLCLYELLTGTRPYEAGSRKELLELFEASKRETKHVPTPHELRASVARELSDITMKAAALDPGERYGTAKECGTALELYMYSSRYGPTNEKLAEYLQAVFPEVDRDRIE